MDDNLKLYNNLRTVPDEAKKKIGGGRLSGMTDINPVWRIKVLTQTFGACGFGWKYQITNKHIEHVTATNEAAAFVDILLYVKSGDTWSEGIPGTGGSSFIAKEKGGLYVSDECYKMALTDALSVACKALGVGADVYFEKDRTKYSQPPTPPLAPVCQQCANPIKGINAGNGKTRSIETIIETGQREFGKSLCFACLKVALEGRNHA